MTIEELNKLIKEELDAFFEAEDEEGGDEIEVTTDEPAAETGEEAMDILRQIYDLIRPEIEGEEAPEDEAEEEEEEGEEPEAEADEEEEAEEVDESYIDNPNYDAKDTAKVTYDAEDVKGHINESFDGAARFKKLANIKG
jgi:hypothetical protein